VIRSREFWVLLIVSLAIAIYGWLVPQLQMPLNYGVMISRSIPFGIAWSVILVFGLWRYKWRGLWLLAGAPAALYWPAWMIFNQFPSCYYSGNCV
jgi:hypothetical protein